MSGDLRNLLGHGGKCWLVSLSCSTALRMFAAAVSTRTNFEWCWFRHSTKCEDFDHLTLLAVFFLPLVSLYVNITPQDAQHKPDRCACLRCRLRRCAGLVRLLLHLSLLSQRLPGATPLVPSRYTATLALAMSFMRRDRPNCCHRGEK
jgi:hypothetical protein